MIDYLVPKFFAHLSTKHSGGMHTKVDRVRRAVSELYKIYIISDLSSVRSEFLLIEPLYFRRNGVDALDELRSHPALVSERTTKILYCSEMEVFRWTGQFRNMIAQLTDDFLEIPDQKRGQSARRWAEQHLSFDCFKGQLINLLRMYYG